MKSSLLSSSKRTKKKIIPASIGPVKEPLHLRLRGMLRQIILTEFKEGDVFYSERELFERLKVSKYTIQQALRDLIGEGFLVNKPRRGNFVRHKESQRIVGYFRSGYHAASQDPDMLALVEECQARDYLLHVYSLNKEMSTDDAVRMVRGQPIDERIILVSLSGDRTAALHAALTREGYTTVMMGGYFPPDQSGNYVGIDVEREAELVISHLTGLGHEKVLFVMDQPEVLMTAKARAMAVQRALKSGRLPKSRLVSTETPNWSDAFEATYEKLPRLLEGFPDATAIVSMSASGAWAALRYCVEHRIEVPGRISLVSFDELSGNSKLPVPLTSLAFDVQKRAQQTVDLLWSDAKEAHYLVDTKLIQRASTAPPGKR